jgi:biopolymer transport protein ExbD
MRVFNERIQNGAYRLGMEMRSDLKEADRIERTVFIKAPRSIDYGEVVKVIDGVKGAGARPIGLQIDDLDE